MYTAKSQPIELHACIVYVLLYVFIHTTQQHTPDMQIYRLRFPSTLSYTSSWIQTIGEVYTHLFQVARIEG